MIDLTPDHAPSGHSILSTAEAIVEARRLGDSSPGNGWRRLLWRMADLLQATANSVSPTELFAAANLIPAGSIDLPAIDQFRHVESPPGLHKATGRYPDTPGHWCYEKACGFRQVAWVVRGGSPPHRLYAVVYGGIGEFMSLDWGGFGRWIGPVDLYDGLG